MGAVRKQMQELAAESQRYIQSGLGTAKDVAAQRLPFEVVQS